YLGLRLSGKARHMEPLWQAADWEPGMRVTRHEARLRRAAIRESGLPGEVRCCLDDPWEFLEHQGEVFAAVVGHVEDREGGACPDAVNVAWLRRMVPDKADANCSRWPTNQIWRVVQVALFADAPTSARRLVRRRQWGEDVKALDRGQYGYLISWTPLLHPNGGQWTLSRALFEAATSLDAILTESTVVIFTSAGSMRFDR